MKKLISIILILAIAASLAACQGRAKPEDPKSQETEETGQGTTQKPEGSAEKEEQVPEGTAENDEQAPEGTAEAEEQVTEEEKEYEIVKDFDKEFFEYVREHGFSGENYMVSALSFKAALCLVTAGASGETQKELLAALGFASTEEMEKWFASVMGAVTAFAERLEEDQAFYKDSRFSGGTPDRAFSLVNSVWNNTGTLGSFKEEFRKTVEEKYGAAAYEKSSDEITEAVNSWCSEHTNGMIPSISDDLSGAASVLVNALYVRAPWIDTFEKGLTHEDAFTDIDGNEIIKTFMEQTKDHLYYEDENCRIVVIPMEGDLQFAAVLGEAEDMEEAIRRAEYEKVHIVIPQMEIENSFDGSIMIGFLKSLGVETAWNGETADFSAMSDDIWYIDDIIQKTKLKTDEDGLEAAAVTAMVMKAAGAFIEEPEVKEFIADEPFSFRIYSGLGGDNEQLLFEGQYVK